MTAWRSSGDVLRWWRHEVLGLTQQQAAERLSVQASALSNWERGTRSISIDLAAVDAALEGGGALADLLWAHGTTDGLDAGHIWTKVFPGPSNPVWLWIRTDAAHIVVEAEWGIFRIDTELEIDANGVFIAVGASLPDSPLVVFLSEPGWADFGHGDLPSNIPSAQIIPAISMVSPSTADGPLMQLFSSNLASKLASGSPDVADLANAAPGSVASFVTKAEQGDGETTAPRWPPRPEGIDAVERARFARLREARQLSVVALADRLAALTDIDVKRDTLRRFETDVGRPHHPMLPIALDHVLGADGRLAAVAVRAGEGHGSVTLPPYWRGPVWIALVPPSGESEVLLRRGNWHREVVVDEPVLVMVHWFDPAVPLRIEADDVEWSVGLGRRAGAQAIDQNWVPTTVDVAQQAIADIETALNVALDNPAHRAGLPGSTGID